MYDSAVSDWRRRILAEKLDRVIYRQVYLWISCWQSGRMESWHTVVIIDFGRVAGVRGRLTDFEQCLGMIGNPQLDKSSMTREQVVLRTAH
jgi:hypothetical protein